MSINRKASKIERNCPSLADDKAQQRHKSKKLAAAEKQARQIARWRERLAPQFPEIDLHDLDLIIAALLRTRRERMEIMFLKQRKDGRYVF